jgi:stress response protein YsnF
VETGRVRVTKRVESHDETIEQEVRQGHVEVKRVAVNRPVEGPMPPRREGNTLIVPVVSEVLRIEKQWILTEEIHLIQTEESRRVNEQVAVAREVAQVQRLDESGRVISEIAGGSPAKSRVLARVPEPTEPKRKVLTRNSGSIVKKS